MKKNTAVTKPNYTANKLLLIFCLVSIIFISICSDTWLYADELKAPHLSDPYYEAVLNNSKDSLKRTDADEGGNALTDKAETYLFSRSVNALLEGITVKGNLPQFRNIGNTTETSGYNDRIMQFYYDSLTELSSDVSSVDFDYRVIDGSNYISIIVLCSKYSGIHEKTVTTVNVNRNTGEEATLLSILGPNGAKVINKLIVQDARKNPAMYSNDIKPVTLDNSFYIDGNTVSLIFNDYEVSPRKDELFEFKLQLSEYTNCYVKKEAYFTATSYNIKMIMAKQIADKFGYELYWNGGIKEIGFRKDGKIIVSMNVGINSYTQEKSLSRKLETFPTLKDGRTYLPISFFEEFLGLVYSVDSDGTICFSEYSAK